MGSMGSAVTTRFWVGCWACGRVSLIRPHPGVERGPLRNAAAPMRPRWLGVAVDVENPGKAVSHAACAPDELPLSGGTWQSL